MNSKIALSVACCLFFAGFAAHSHNSGDAASSLCNGGGSVEKSVAVDANGRMSLRDTLFRSSDGDGVRPPYRIPGIAVHGNHLIATAARLVCGTDPGMGQVDVVCRVSDDNGETWSDMIDVAVGTGRTSATENFFDTAFGDPAVVADRESNEVMVLAVAGCTLYFSKNTNRSNPEMIALIRSHDGGLTWDEPVNITETIYSLFDDGVPMDAAFVGGGRVFQSRVVKVGSHYRVYAALAARPQGNRVVYSDDFGTTWHALGGSSATPVVNGDEPKCDEMPDGRVIISSRTKAGRYYNIFTYTDTRAAEGSWGECVKSTFEGAGVRAGNNATNGELLVVPVRRISDGRSVYLALQTLPVGDGRTDVGIYYKELASPGDMCSPAAFATGWDGFYRLTDQTSAYSSIDLKADGWVAMIYEANYTSFGMRPNVISTSFPTGEGEHHFDGFDNVYAHLPIELITDGAYEYDGKPCRGAFLASYFTALAGSKELSGKTRKAVKRAAKALPAEPAVGQIDAIYKLLAGKK